MFQAFRQLPDFADEPFRPADIFDSQPLRHAISPRLAFTISWPADFDTITLTFSAADIADTPCAAAFAASLAGFRRRADMAPCRHFFSIVFAIDTPLIFSIISAPLLPFSFSPTFHCRLRH